MKDVRLIANNIQLDLPAGGDIAPLLTLGLQDYARIGSVLSSGVKRSITLPSTATNRNALRTERVPARLLVGGIEVFTGEAIVTQRTRRQDKEVSISVALSGGNGDWLAALKGQRLADIIGDFGSHTLDSGTVQTALTAGIGTGDFAYAPIKRGAWAIAGEVQHYECTPLLFIRQILERALNQAGYRLESDFFQMGVYQAMVMPVLLPEKYGEEYGQDFLNEEWTDASGQTITDVTGAVLVFGTSVNTTGNWNSTLNRYIVPEDGFYRMSMTVEFAPEPVTFPAQIEFSFRKNGVRYQVVYPTSALPDVVQCPANEQRTFTGSCIFEANAGDFLDFRFDPFLSLSGAKVASARMSIEGEAKIQSGSSINFRYLLGSMTFGQLIAGLTHCFNLVWQLEQGRAVRVEPADDYLDVRAGAMRAGFYSQTALQVSTQAETSQDTIVRRFGAEEFWQLGYETDDETIANLEARQPLPQQSAQFQFARPEKPSAINVIENPFFAKTAMFFDAEITVFDTPAPPQPVSSIVSIPIIYDGDFFQDTTKPNRTEAKPRLLLRVTTQLTPDGQVAAGAFNYEGTAQPLSIETLSVGMNQFDLNQPSLSFGDTVVRGFVVPGLMRCFYSQHLSRLNQGEIREERYTLRLSEVVRFDFRRKLYRDNVRWIIYSVDGYNPISSDSTKLIIMRDARADTTPQTYSQVPVSINRNPLA
jgi:hypothetical protein